MDWRSCTDLLGRGRGVKVTRAFVQNEVVCDYNGKLLTNKEGKEKYKNSEEQAMGYMFTFHTAVYCSSATSIVVGVLTCLTSIVVGVLLLHRFNGVLSRTTCIT